MVTQTEVANEVVIRRTFNAPVEQVWKAWTDCERIKQWWGPKTFTAPSCSSDFREGGKYLFSMRSPEGKDFWSTGSYRQIVPNKRLVMADSFSDEHGNVVPATYYGMSSAFSLEMQVTVTFEEQGGKTRMVLRHSGLPAGLQSEQARAGWNGSFDKLADHLANGK